MAEIGLIASVIQVAGAGLKLSQTLYQYADTVASADRRVKDIAKEVRLTSFVIEELGTLFRHDETNALLSKNALRTAGETVRECSTVFLELDAALSRKSKNKTLERLKFPFKESKIELLRSHIDKLKSTLQLLMQVLTHAHQVASQKLDREAEAAQREHIKALLQNKKDTTKRYEESLKNFNMSEGSTILDDDESDNEVASITSGLKTVVSTASTASSITTKTLETCVQHIQVLLEDIEDLQKALANQAEDGSDHSELHQSLIGSYFRARGHLDGILLGNSKDLQDGTGSTATVWERPGIGITKSLTGSTLLPTDDSLSGHIIEDKDAQTNALLPQTKNMTSRERMIAEHARGEERLKIYHNLRRVKKEAESRARAEKAAAEEAKTKAGTGANEAEKFDEKTNRQMRDLINQASAHSPPGDSGTTYALLMDLEMDMNAWNNWRNRGETTRYVDEEKTANSDNPKTARLEQLVTEDQQARIEKKKAKKEAASRRHRDREELSLAQEVMAKERRTSREADLQPLKREGASTEPAAQASSVSRVLKRSKSRSELDRSAGLAKLMTEQGEPPRPMPASKSSLPAKPIHIKAPIPRFLPEGEEGSQVGPADHKQVDSELFDDATLENFDFDQFSSSSSLDDPLSFSNGNISDEGNEDTTRVSNSATPISFSSPRPAKAYVSEEISFHYDPDLKKWVSGKTSKIPAQDTGTEIRQARHEPPEPGDADAEHTLPVSSPPSALTTQEEAENENSDAIGNKIINAAAKKKLTSSEMKKKKKDRMAHRRRGYELGLNKREDDNAIEDKYEDAAPALDNSAQDSPTDAETRHVLELCERMDEIDSGPGGSATPVPVEYWSYSLSRQKPISPPIDMSEANKQTIPTDAEEREVDDLLREWTTIDLPIN